MEKVCFPLPFCILAYNIIIHYYSVYYDNTIFAYHSSAALTFRESSVPFTLIEFTTIVELLYMNYHSSLAYLLHVGVVTQMSGRKIEMSHRICGS